MALVVVTDHVFSHLDAETTLLEEAGHRLLYQGPLSTPPELIDLVQDADAVLNCYAPLPAEVIQAMGRCRVIARYGIGVDGIDLDAASGQGIWVTNVPQYCIQEVSDHVMGLLLCLTRGVITYDRDVHEGRWEPKHTPPLHRPTGRLLGLVGFGKIARLVAMKAKSFGYAVAASDPLVPRATIESVGVVAMELEELLLNADVVSLHAPLTKDTHHLIDGRALALMRSDAYLINTSRGGLVDEHALYDALAEGRIAAAGLDVLEAEPPGADNPLLRLPNVIITPHAAFYSEESLAQLQREAVEQVIIALQDRQPPYAINVKEVRAHRSAAPE